MDYCCEKIVRNEQLYRLKEEQATGPLHRSIGALTFLNTHKKLGMGSAVLISPNLVLTVAHNIYDRAYNCENEDFKFYLGANGVASSYFEIQSFRYPQEFTTCQKNIRLEYDYALIKLKKPASYDKYLTLTSSCQKCLMENNKLSQMQIFGYPAQYKDNYEPLDKYASKFVLYQFGASRPNRIVLVDPQKFLLAYALSTLPGQSGSPVYINNAIIAIHNGGGKENQDFNVGRLITRDMIENLNKWQTQLKGIRFSMIQNKVCPHSKIILPLKKDKNSDLEIAEATIRELTARLQQQREKNRKQEALINELKQQLKFHRSQASTSTHSLIAPKKTGKKTILLEDKQLKTYDVTKELNLSELVLSSNKLTEINLKNNRDLVKLVLKENQIKHIELRHNPNLTELCLQFNQLTEIDLSKNTELTELSLYNNQLTHIDLTSNKKLVTLYIFCNKLDQIYLFENTLLEKVNVSSNKIKEIELSTNKNLSILNIHDNFLQMIDLRNNLKLTGLRLSSNQLRHIDLINHQNLSEIYLNANNLRASTICYLPKFNVDLADQTNEICVLKLVHKKEEGEECRKWGQAKVQLYNKKRDYNKHGCQYSLQTIQYA